jgi:hypothetical protein
MALVQQKKIVVAGALFVTALLLTTVSALFNEVTQTGSVIALSLMLIPLALAVVALLAGFHWILEKWVDSEEVDRVEAVAKQRASHYGFSQRKDSAFKGPKTVDSH